MFTSGLLPAHQRGKQLMLSPCGGISHPCLCSPITSKSSNQCETSPPTINPATLQPTMMSVSEGFSFSSSFPDAVKSVVGTASTMAMEDDQKGLVQSQR
mmetsp:Transcript_5880/g.9080  ORF Transcript_5880/g.9080 Transcript_5880/m.9080 type:complete len:99 (-) Transcript_5880:48-344(-)